jgi:hypothetical protein
MQHVAPKHSHSHTITTREPKQHQEPTTVEASCTLSASVKVAIFDCSISDVISWKSAVSSIVVLQSLAGDSNCWLQKRWRNVRAYSPWHSFPFIIVHNADLCLPFLFKLRAVWWWCYCLLIHSDRCYYLLTKQEVKGRTRHDKQGVMFRPFLLFFVPLIGANVSHDGNDAPTLYAHFWVQFWKKVAKNLVHCEWKNLCPETNIVRFYTFAEKIAVTL